MAARQGDWQGTGAGGLWGAWEVGGKRGHRRAELQFSRLLFMLSAGLGRKHSDVQYELSRHLMIVGKGAYKFRDEARWIPGDDWSQGRPCSLSEL